MKKRLNYINDKIFVKIIWLHSATMFRRITAGMYKTLVKNISAYKNNIVGLSKVVSTSYYLGFITTIYKFLITELFLIVITYFSSVYLIDAFGVEGANIGYFVSYLLYYIAVLLIFGSSLFGVISEDIKSDD